VFFKPGKRLLCAYACKRERERCCRSSGGIGSFFRKIHCTYTTLSDTQNVRKFFCHNKVQKLRRRRKDQQKRARRRARASEQASEQHSRRPPGGEREREREKTPGNTGSPGHRVPPAPRRPAGSDPLFLRKSKITKHYVDGKKKVNS